MTPKKPIGESKKTLLQKTKEKGFAIGKDILLMAIAGLLLVVIGGVGGYFLNKKLNQKGVIVDNDSRSEESETIENEPADEEEAVKIVDQIEWNEPVEIADQGLFTEYAKEEWKNMNGESWKDFNKYYKVGKILSGKYKDGEIILITNPDMGLMSAGRLPINRVIKLNNHFTLLSRNTDDLLYMYFFDKSKISIDSYVIQALDPKEDLVGLKSRQILKWMEFGMPSSFSQDGKPFFHSDNLKFVFKDEKMGDVYTDTDPVGDEVKKNGFYVKMPDGTQGNYTLKIDFMENGEITPEIIWENGEKNTGEYLFTDTSGCGSTNYISVVSKELVDINNDLKVTGENSKGDSIYELKDENHKLLKDFYETGKFNFDGVETKEISYKEFVSSRPLFFWIDPFGRLIKFKNNKFIPLAECGKPVIYLYPEKDTNVSVKVEPRGGMSYSDPEYNGGWNVFAKTNGDLYDLKTGNYYPYLFWEGRGGIYEAPKNGFVVKREEVHNFLVEKLGKFGLNKKEIADFCEFWEPRMQGAPYYFVGFLGNAAMNNIAPLTTSPKPDTVIRILMDFTPLEKPIKAKGYEIKTPERKGFTVVEWGGVLR